MTPDKFLNDMMKLAKQSPHDAADVANTWRNRYLNDGGMGSRTSMQVGGEVLTGFTTGFVYGTAGGWFKAEDDDIWEDWKLDGYKIANLASWEDGSPYKEGNAVDKERYPSMKPGTLWGIPFSLLATLAIGLSAMGKVGGRFNNYVESAAAAGIVYWGSQVGDLVGYDLNMKRIKKAELAALGQAA